ncbi:MAG: ABC transporter substrate-binding protein [Pseudomonadota bacterium]
MLLCTFLVWAFESSAAQEMRIVTLSPHLTEMVYTLGKGDSLVGVSEYSDFPESASALPRIASYQGANISEIIRLRPTHILIWKGGNKASDILKLSRYSETNAAEVYISNVDGVDSLLDEILSLGEFLGTSSISLSLVKQLQEKISEQKNENLPMTDVYYYMGISPLYGLGNDPWLNSLLNICNIHNKNKNAAAAYMALDKAHILRKPPEAFITSDGVSLEQHEAFWQAHRGFLHAPIFTVNPDAMHRFTPRAIYETIKLCGKLRTIEK